MAVLLDAKGPRSFPICHDNTDPGPAVIQQASAGTDAVSVDNRVEACRHSTGAVHLATAQLWVEYTDRDLTFLTHDRQLGFAARALGLQVMGDEEE